MRVAKNFQDVNTILRGILDWQSDLQTKSQDLHQNKITNASPGTDPYDYATVSQLPEITATPPTPDQHYSVVWNTPGVATTGQILPAFIIGSDRVGTPTEAYVYATGAPSGGAATFNFQINGSSILVSDLTLPAGQQGPIYATNFVSPLPFFGKGVTITPVITNGNGANIVTLTIQVLRSS